MDLDETDAQVQEAEAALARAKEQSAAQSEGRHTPASVTRQPERKLNWTKPSTMLVVLFLMVSLMWGEVQPSLLSTGNGEQKFRILSVSMSTWGPQAEGVLRSAEVGRFQTVALAEHHLGANSCSKLDKLWKQSGFLGMEQQPNSRKCRPKAPQAVQA